MGDCELGIPTSKIGLYPVETNSGSMAIELHLRDRSDNDPDPNAVCLIKSAIAAHLKAIAGGETNLPNNFAIQAICKRCADRIKFVAEEY